ncbi:hypothetical protein ACFWVB_20215 [Streptomyces microflavus]|uniref:hypothetical protein n=1 Tax=Streptomyces microflavus TaxID=1919 RepID=UPI0036540084
MARCGCGGDECKCEIVAGENVTVAGNGNGAAGTPWVISAGTTEFECASLNSCSLDDLGDTSTPAPVTGDLLLWNGVAWVPGRVVFQVC